MAKAYWISCYRKITDPAKLAAYAKLAGPAIEAGGGRFLARATAAKAYEDGKTERTVLIVGIRSDMRFSSGPVIPATSVLKP